MKKLFCLMLTLALLCCAYGMGEENTVKTFTMSGYDGETTYTRSWDTCKFFERMTDLTGVSFTFSQYSEASAWTARKASMTSDDATLTDVLFKADLSRQEMNDLYEKGVLIDLTPYLEECCPNLWALLQENPQYLEEITLQNGAIVALPYIAKAPIQNCLWINTTWLSNVKKEMPTDIESLTDVLRAFRDKDPNQNGKSDEIPLAFLGAFDLKFLAHGFGLYCNDYNIYAQDGQVYFMPLQDNFRPFIEWCRACYEEGLFDIDGFGTTDTLRTVTDSDATKTYGSIITTALTNLFPSDWVSEYQVVLPLVYEGKQVYRAFYRQCYGGTFAVTCACQDVESVLSWVDALYGMEGAKIASVGLQNVDYVVDGDGTWRVTDSAQNDTYFTTDSLISTGNPYPGISPDEFELSYSETAIAQISAQMIELNQIASSPFPQYTLTQEQKDYITPLQNQIGRYVDEQIARFVLGETEINDQTFAEFEQELYHLGLADFMTFWQNILDNLNQ